MHYAELLVEPEPVPVSDIREVRTRPGAVKHWAWHRHDAGAPVGVGCSSPKVA